MRFLFDINIENFEWGYRDMGLLITDEGVIYKYDITTLENRFKRNRYEDKFKYSKAIFYLSPQYLEKLSNLLIGIKSQLTNESFSQAINYICYLSVNNAVQKINISSSNDSNSYEYKLSSELKNICKTFMF